MREPIEIDPDLNLPAGDAVLDAMIDRDLDARNGAFSAFRDWLWDQAYGNGLSVLARHPGAIVVANRVLSRHTQARIFPEDLARAFRSELAYLDGDKTKALEVLAAWHEVLLAEQTQRFRRAG